MWLIANMRVPEFSLAGQKDCRECKETVPGKQIKIIDPVGIYSLGP